MNADVGSPVVPIRVRAIRRADRGGEGFLCALVIVDKLLFVWARHVDGSRLWSGRKKKGGSVRRRKPVVAVMLIA